MREPSRRAAIEYFQQGGEARVVIDPIDGTTLTAKGMANAVAVMAVSPRGTM